MIDHFASTTYSSFTLTQSPIQLAAEKCLLNIAVPEDLDKTKKNPNDLGIVSNQEQAKKVPQKPAIQIQFLASDDEEDNNRILEEKFVEFFCAEDQEEQDRKNQLSLGMFTKKAKRALEKKASYLVEEQFSLREPHGKSQFASRPVSPQPNFDLPLKSCISNMNFKIDESQLQKPHQMTIIKGFLPLDFLEAKDDQLQYSVMNYHSELHKAKAHTPFKPKPEKISIQFDLTEEQMQREAQVKLKKRGSPTGKSMRNKETAKQAQIMEIEEDEEVLIQDQQKRPASPPAVGRRKNPANGGFSGFASMLTQNSSKHISDLHHSNSLKYCWNRGQPQSQFPDI